MYSNKILILSDEFDTHADSVAERIIASGGEYLRLNLNIEALKRTTITSADGCWVVFDGDMRFSEEEIGAVWPRRLTVSRTLEQQFDVENNDNRLWRNEWNRTLYGLYATLREKYWLNPIQAASLADNKFYQSAVARKLGILVPEWIVSNSKMDLIDFADRHGDVALKFMSQDMYRDADGGFLGLYVNKITSETLENFGNCSENPVTLQEYKEKSFEVRYTVVGDVHFVCAIYSQESERARTDWRRYDIPNTPHEAIDPPGSIRLQVSNLMSALGLNYGALDFIVDPTGQWWFLEVNTAGQWLWIEDLTGLPISSEIARLLVARGKGKCE